MFEVAAWKTLFGAVGVLALLGIPVVLWMRRRAMRRARGSAYAWGGLLEGGSGGGTPDVWEDVSSRFIEDFIPDVEEGKVEPAQRENVPGADENVPGSLDDVEEGVRVIEGERSEVLPEDEVLPEEDEEAELPVDDAPTVESSAPWWEDLPAPREAGYRRTVDQLVDDASDEARESPEGETSRHPVEDARTVFRGAEREGTGADPETRMVDEKTQEELSPGRYAPLLHVGDAGSEALGPEVGDPSDAQGDVSAEQQDSLVESYGDFVDAVDNAAEPGTLPVGEGALTNKEGAPEADETGENADVPKRLRIPAVSEIRNAALSGDDAPHDEEEGEVLQLTREGEGVAEILPESVQEAGEDVDDEAPETTRESLPESRFRDQEEKQEEENLPPRDAEMTLDGDEADKVSPDARALASEDVLSRPEPEEEVAPALAPEDDLISLMQRERREDEAFSGSGASDEETEERLDAEEPDFPLDDDVEQLARTGGASLPAASHEAPANTPSELIRELVEDIFPGDLLLIENMEQTLPAWTSGVVNAARIDLGQRENSRQTPTAEEYLRLAAIEMTLGHNEEATEHLKESLRRTSRLAPVLNALAVASCLRDKVEPAISYCREAFREAGRDASIQAVIYRNLGYFYQRKGDYAQAAESYEKALGCIGPQGEITQLSTLRMRIGRLLRRIGDSEKAKEHFSEAAHLYHRLGNRRSEARAHIALASVRSEAGEYELAQASLEEALSLCQKTGDKAGEALVFGQMGVSFAAQEQFTRALRYYENALRLNRGLENRKSEAANLSGMGNIHYARGDFPEAREAYEAALKISRELDDTLAQAVVLGNLGRVYFEAQEWEDSRERLTEAGRIFRELGASESLDNIKEMLRALERRS